MDPLSFDQDTLQKIKVAQASGHSPQEILQRAAQYQATKAQQTPVAAPRGNFITDSLPFIGGVGGSLLGGIAGPGGVIAGGAAGSGLGELLKQLLTGGGLNGADIAKETAFGAAGGVAGKALSPLLSFGSRLAGKTLPGVLNKVGNEFVASQYNVPRSAARALDLPGTIEALSKYGIHDINKIAPAAEQVTGANGIVSQLTRKAVAKAGPVDTTGILDLAKSIAGNPSIPQGQDKKLIEFVHKGLQKISGGDKGSLAVGSDPSEVFGFIQQLEKQAAQINRIPQFQRTAQDTALKNGYTMLADELKQRLFQGAGADSALAAGLLTPEQGIQLALIHPELAREISSAQTVGDLRRIAAPFVKGAQLASETEAGSQIGFNNVGGAVKGVGKLVQNPLNLLAVPLGSDVVNAGAGAAAKSAAGKLSNIPEPGNIANIIGALLGQGTAQATGNAAIPGSAQAMEAEIVSPQDSTIPRPGSTGEFSTGNPQEDALRKTLGTIMLSKAKSVSDIKTAYEFLYPSTSNKKLSVTAQTQANLAKSGIRGLQEVKQIIAEKGAGVLAANDLIPGHLLSRKYDSALFRTVEALLRARSGAAVPEQEVRRYLNKFGPKLGDDQGTIEFKLQQLEQDFNDVLTGTGNTSSFEMSDLQNAMLQQ